MKPKYMTAALLGMIFLIGGCCKRHSEKAPPPSPLTNDIQRFQLYYAPYPQNFETTQNNSPGNMKMRTSRLFLIDTKLGRIWVYKPEVSVTLSNDIETARFEGFSPIAVVNDDEDLLAKPDGKQKLPFSKTATP